MTALARLRTALLTITSEVAENIYEGKADTFIAYNLATMNPSGFADDTPTEEEYYYQIHLFIPRGTKHTTWEARIKSALTQGGFAYPSINYDTVEADKAGSMTIRHICFETNIESEV